MAEPLFGEVPIGIDFAIPQQSYQSQGHFSRLTDDSTRSIPPQTRQFRVASSLYSATPNPNMSTVNGPSITPRASLRGLWGPRPLTRPIFQSPNGSRAHLPSNCQMPATSYSPASMTSEWNDQEVVTDRVPLSGARSHNNIRGQDRSTENLVEATIPNTDDPSSHPSRSSREARSGRRKKQKRRHHRQNAWVRSHRPGTSTVPSRSVLHSKTTAKNHGVSVVVAALFLGATVITYLAIALSVKGLAEELHILFALTIAGALIFLVHSLIRFFAARKRRAARRRHRVNAKQLASGPSFAPVRPIRVHMALDEEIAAQNEDGAVIHEKVGVTMPPPAYGLWRSSVKVNPNLLFWHRVEPHGHTSAQTQSRELDTEGQYRPPSYISDDGVSYAVAAEPRSVVSVQRPPSQLHPAYRH